MKVRLLAAPVVAAALFVTGCETQPAAVPSDATIVTQGDDDLIFTAPSSGSVFVHEENSDRLLYSGKVDAGDRVELDRERDRLIIDGQVVSEKDLGSVGNHVIRFQPGDDVSRRTVILRERRLDRD